MMKYYGKSLLLSLMKSGYNNEVDSKFGDDINMRVFDGYMRGLVKDIILRFLISGLFPKGSYLGICGMNWLALLPPCVTMTLWHTYLTHSDKLQTTKSAQAG